MEMFRTEKIWLKTSKNLSKLCHLSKKLYNEANYIIRQNFFFGSKWVRYYELNILRQESDNYKALPPQTAQQILLLLDKSWKSFFASMKDWKQSRDKYNGKPCPPRYKRKDGEHTLTFTNQQCRIENGKLIPKKVNLEVETRLPDDINLREVRIVPRDMVYVCEIFYEREVKHLPKDSSRFAEIDLGVRNLVTISNNIDKKPIVVKGRVARSINQFYNKEASLHGIYEKKGNKSGRKLRKLTDKRNRKIHNLLHKVSGFVIDWCSLHNIGTMVIGHNNGWKQEIEQGTTRISYKSRKFLRNRGCRVTPVRYSFDNIARSNLEQVIQNA